VVPKGTPGLSQGKKETKIGIRASHTAEIILENCRIPAENLLGGMEKLEKKLDRARKGESSGRASNALATFELTRPVVGASALGIAQAAYEWTISYLGNGHAVDPIELALDESSTAGNPPLEQQSVQQPLAQVATELDAARLLVQRASWMGRNGIPLTGGQGSMSKLKAGQVAVWATRTLIDLVGPAAQSTDLPIEKWFRDAKIYELFEGTAEIQRRVISRMQVAEYQEKLKEAAEIAGGASGNGSARGNNGDAVSDAVAAVSDNGATADKTATPA
jgi:alkylation response protein AidB-like acyl-CoA dehydrogenase